MDKIKKCLKSPWWKIVNSALFVGILTTSISTCKKTEQLNISVENTNQQVANLEVAINNSISQTNQLAVANENQVNIVNQSITKVEREIANIKEAIHQHYNAVVCEVFHISDENVKIKLIPIPDKEDVSALFFALEKSPEPKSVKIITNKGTLIPFTTTKTKRNVIMVSVKGLRKLFPSKDTYYEVLYVPNYFTDYTLYTLEGIETKKVKNGIFDFHLKKRNNEIITKQSTGPDSTASAAPSGR